MEAVHNVLVISDLHLGEDLGNASEARRQHVQQTDDALQAFFAHYCLTRVDGLPWKLVINGDMVDFLSVPLVPEEVGVEGDDDDATFGFGATEAVAVHKLERVIERHTGFFDGLARFLDVGNEVHIVTGNHDAEFHFEGVRTTFRKAMGLRTTVQSPKLFFHPWFFLEPGFAYLEHGHQYDPFCSFDDPLTPEDLDDPTVLEENLGTAAMRYLGNHLPVDPDATADLSFVEYLRLLANARAEVTNRFLGGYAAVVRVLLTQWWTRLRHPTAWLRRKDARKKRLAQLSLMTGLDAKLLNRLQKLRRPPVFVGMLQLIRSVMLGRLVSAVLLPPALFSTVWLAVFVSLRVAFFGSLAVLAAFVALQVWLAMGRDDVDPTESMGKTAARITKLVGAPVVVFGHSHIPLARRLGKRSWYFNTGSWAGGADRSGAFTHLVLTHVGRHVRAALCRWQGDQSRELRVETTGAPRRRRPVGMSTGY
jgi:UDP-2,3-diacylglucosamine pyrophosphatase LpxH